MDLWERVDNRSCFDLQARIDSVSLLDPSGSVSDTIVVVGIRGYGFDFPGGYPALLPTLDHPEQGK
ncbi:hypothetical protein M6B38_116475 [Iris pallida]|uniref:Uncharacterized protein n=1 Tax=Iris pallida TaxID=29817 RepID=A0AAX6I4F2_IRIPA|nr:hypothetical protein M6B38_116475 [Iris pallida]